MFAESVFAEPVFAELVSESKWLEEGPSEEQLLGSRGEGRARKERGKETRMELSLGVRMRGRPPRAEPWKPVEARWETTTARRKRRPRSLLSAGQLRSGQRQSGRLRSARLKRRHIWHTWPACLPPCRPHGSWPHNFRSEW